MKSLLSLFFIASFLLISVHGQTNCAQYNGDCSDCTANDCGYCAANMQCVPGTVNGPTNTSNSCEKGWQFITCHDCHAYGTCAQCSFDDACAFCEGGKGCQLIGNATQSCALIHTCHCYEYENCRSCTTNPTCTYCVSNSSCIYNTGSASCDSTEDHCPCANNEDCPSCLADFGCQWCEDDGGSCVEGDATCSLAAYDCPPPGRQFDGLSFFGGMVLGAAIVGIIAGVLVCVIRHRNRKYQPL